MRRKDRGMTLGFDLNRRGRTDIEEGRASGILFGHLMFEAPITHPSRVGWHMDMLIWSLGSFVRFCLKIRVVLLK